MTDPIGTAQERELIERVAKAIYHTTPDLCSWDDLFEVVRERGRVKARAAIEAAGVQSRIAEVERLTARVNELEAVLAETLPKNLCLTNKNVRDDAIVSIDCTMGELRNISAALSQHRKL